MGETGYTETKSVSRRIEWLKVLDATEKPRMLGRKGMLGLIRRRSLPQELQNKMEAAASLCWIEQSTGGEIWWIDDSWRLTVNGKRHRILSTKLSCLLFYFYFLRTQAFENRGERE